jgi:hypothetical protein
VRTSRIVGLLVVFVLAFAHAPIAHALTLSPSCVDLDNDGTCGAKEPLLAPLLDANGGSFDVTAAVPGYVPPGGAVGIILNNYTSSRDTLSIYATGDIRINGKLKMKNVESVDLENEQDVFVGTGASMTFGGGRCCVSDFTVITHNLEFGLKSQLKVGGEDSFWDIEAKNIDIGDGAKFQAKGDAAGIEMDAENRITLGLNTQFKTVKDGSVTLTAFQSIVATGLRITSGTIDIEAFPPEDGHIPGRSIALTNSVINQSDPDGSLTMLAGDTFAPKDTDEVVLVHTLLVVRSGFADIEPEPKIS